MTTAREVLFSSKPKCFSDSCLLGGSISHGDDVLVIWINRCVFPVGIADLMNLDGQFEIWHTDCFKNYSKGEEKENARSTG